MRVLATIPTVANWGTVDEHIATLDLSHYMCEIKELAKMAPGPFFHSDYLYYYIIPSFHPPGPKQ